MYNASLFVCMTVLVYVNLLMVDMKFCLFAKYTLRVNYIVLCLFGWWNNECFVLITCALVYKRYNHVAQSYTFQGICPASVIRSVPCLIGSLITMSIWNEYSNIWTKYNVKDCSSFWNILYKCRHFGTSIDDNKIIVSSANSCHTFARIFAPQLNHSVNCGTFQLQGSQ